MVSVADPGIFQRGGSTLKVGFQKGGFHSYLGFSKGGYTLEMRYFNPIFTKFSDERGGSDPRNPPSGSANGFINQN
jgi:hypothetical protein